MIKELKARIPMKHDTEGNWNKATNFVPLAGEMIIYDIDNGHSTPRIKIGDGVTKIGNLPFITNDLSNIPEDKLYIVNVTLNSMTAGTSDKNSSEIYAVVGNGKIPVVATTAYGQRMRAFLTSSTNSSAVFIYNNLGYNTSQQVGRMIINASGDVSITWQQYAEKASPAFTGTPTAPTATAGTNTTQIATTAFVQAALPTIDTTITQNSTNAISSGAVYDAIGNIETALEALL